MCVVGCFRCEVGLRKAARGGGSEVRRLVDDHVLFLVLRYWEKRFLFLQAGSFGNGDCGEAVHQDLRRVRRDFATLLQEIFGEQAERDTCSEDRCGDAFSAIIQGRGIHVRKAVSKTLRASPC